MRPQNKIGIFNVSIHAPTRGATFTQADVEKQRKFQFTRPRGARLRRRNLRDGLPVSIHAPTRGATYNELIKDPMVLEVSIHAPTRGATPNYNRKENLPCFNSRAHAGRDRPPGDHRHHTSRFNSRAHAGRDTLSPMRPLPSRRFNSRAHAGRDPKNHQPKNAHSVSIHAPTRGATPAAQTTVSVCGFQFTRPRGARHTPKNERKPEPCFNSRAHAGRDNRSPMSNRVRRVSIHAPTRGATGLCAARPQNGAFQFTRPRGARPERGRPGGVPGVSIHAPTRGATCRIQVLKVASIVSIHAPTRGATG